MLNLSKSCLQEHHCLSLHQSQRGTDYPWVRGNVLWLWKGLYKVPLIYLVWVGFLFLIFSILTVTSLPLQGEWPYPPAPKLPLYEAFLSTGLQMLFKELLP